MMPQHGAHDGEGVGPVSELRVALTVEDFDTALAFYRDALGLDVAADWSGDQGRCVALNAGRATLELIDARQADYVDQVEVGRRLSGPVRFAVAVPDPVAAAATLQASAARVESAARRTPWGDLNARVTTPEGMQLTLFVEPPR